MPACQPSITKVKSCAAAPGRPHSVSISLSFCFSPPEPSSISHLQEKYFFVVCKSASMPQSVLGFWTSQVQAVVSCHFLPLPNLSSSEDCPKPTAVLVSALLLKVGCFVSSAVEDVHFFVLPNSTPTLDAITVCPLQARYEQKDLLHNEECVTQNVLEEHFSTGPPTINGGVAVDLVLPVCLILMDWKIADGWQEVLVFNCHTSRVEFRSWPLE